MRPPLNFHDAMPLQITSMANYLAERQALIGARESLFQAVRTFLRPEQRIDAVQLGDATPRAPYRLISDDEWVMNPARGYAVILPAPHKGRPFKLSVLQLGNTLRVGIKISAHNPESDSEYAATRFQNLFSDVKPLAVGISKGADVMMDWQFNVKDIYTDVQAYEDAVYRIAAVFELALQVYSVKA